jgi:isoamylase
VRHWLKKSLLTTLMLSSGVPMLSMGDEVSRTQNGSNNAYSLPLNMTENESSTSAAFGGGWALNWNLNEEEEDMLDSVAELARIRSTFLANISSEFFTGTLDLGTQRKDIAWLNLSGEEMGDDYWKDSEQRSITVYIEANSNRALLLLLNSSPEELEFTLPSSAWGESFRCIFDGSKRAATYEPEIAAPSAKVKVMQHSAQVWLVSRVLAR